MRMRSMGRDNLGLGFDSCRRGRETIKRYDVTETYSHVVRQNLQKRKLRVLNPARIHVFYWFNWLNLIGS